MTQFSNGTEAKKLMVQLALLSEFGLVLLIKAIVIGGVLLRASGLSAS